MLPHRLISRTQYPAYWRGGVGAAAGGSLVGGRPEGRAVAQSIAGGTFAQQAQGAGTVEVEETETVEEEEV